MARKNKDEMEVGDVSEDTGGSRVYELGFHLDPELPSEEVKKTFQIVKEVIESKGALVAEGEPEKVQLAYTISRQETSGRRDFDSAFFAWIVYETSAENHAAVLEEVTSNTRVIRFIDIVTSKDAARHAAEMRAMAIKAPEKYLEAVSDVELDAALEGAAA